MDAVHPKIVLHEALQHALQQPELTFDDRLRVGVLSRWALVAELVLQDSKTGLVTISSTAGHMDLHSWDRGGLFVAGAVRAYQGQS